MTIGQGPGLASCLVQWRTPVYKLPQAILDSAGPFKAGGEARGPIMRQIREKLDHLTPDPNEIDKSLRGENVRMSELVKTWIDLREGTFHLRSTHKYGGCFPHHHDLDRVLGELGMERLPAPFMADRVKIVGDEKSPAALRAAKFFSAFLQALGERWATYLIEPPELPSHGLESPARGTTTCRFQGDIDIELRWSSLWKPLWKRVGEFPLYYLEKNLFERGVHLVFSPREADGGRLEGWPVLEGGVAAFEEVMTRSPLQLKYGEATGGEVLLSIPPNTEVDEDLWEKLGMTKDGRFTGQYSEPCEWD